jgi:hypothetical protein
MDTYKATNTTNGKFYIGSTTNFGRRKIEHLGCTENYPFQNALRKNPEAFEWEVWSDDSDEPRLGAGVVGYVVRKRMLLQSEPVCLPSPFLGR